MNAERVSVHPDVDVRRPLWPWLLAVVAAVVGVGVLCTQAQTAARDAEHRSTSAVMQAGLVTASGAFSDASATAGGATSLGATDESVSGAEGTRGPAPAGVAVADGAWSTVTAAHTGIPDRAVRAYASAALTLLREQPGCGLGWNTLAGLGAIESAHGSHGGGVLRADGYPDPPIRGIALDGAASAAIADTDGGRFDGDAVWDRAVGPLQFIPSTWEHWGADANGDGVADPNQIDDAALAAARYLCAAGEMTTPAGWRRAVFSYNHLDSYVDDVAAAANSYAHLAG